MHKVRARIDELLPGLFCSAIVALAALFLSEHYGASAMLFALLLGMSLNFLGQEGKCVAGIEFASSAVLRVGVALLGLRITFQEIASLGMHTALTVVAAVVLTILFGWALARLTSESPRFGILTGGAVAICGASAALAIAAVLPRGKNHDRDTSFAVIGVTALSTLTMIVYPIVSSSLGFSPRDAGIFLGGTIHDVAQVVGAGYSLGKDAGDTATIVKLLRVSMLLPAILLLSFLFHSKPAPDRPRPPLLPWFVVAFALLVGINSIWSLPASVLPLAETTSRFALVLAISAMGMRTSLKDLAAVGLIPVLLMVAETVFLACFVAALIAAQSYVRIWP